MYIGVIIRNIIISYYYLLLLSQVYNHKYELDMGNNVDQTIQITNNDKTSTAEQKKNCSLWRTNEN